MFFKLNTSKFNLIYFSKFFRLIESLPSINISSYLSLAPSSTIHSLGFIFEFSISLIPGKKSVAKSSFCSSSPYQATETFPRQSNPQTTSSFAYFVPL